MQWLSTEEWRVLFASFRRDAFHLELRDTYGVAGEASRFSRWLAGERQSYEEVAAWFSDWTTKVRAASQAGKTIRRVRVVSEPISDYIAFEWHDTPHNIEAGEDIRWLPRHRLPADLIVPVDGNDFWLLDDAQVIVNHFDDGGRSRGKELITDPATVAECVKARESLWELAIPHAEYEPVMT
jgi:hypothetical protein